MSVGEPDGLSSSVDESADLSICVGLSAVSDVDANMSLSVASAVIVTATMSSVVCASTRLSTAVVLA